MCNSRRSNIFMRRIRGCPVQGRDGGDDNVWMEPNILFGKLSDIKKEIFQASNDTLLNLYGSVIVFDDKLMPSGGRC